MTQILSDEQQMLVDQSRRLLEESSSGHRLRALIEGEQDWDEPLWRQLGDLGFLGIAIDENFGGLGLTFQNLCLVSEELGRANAAVPFLSSLGLAAGALQLAGSDAQKARWLPLLASGEIVGTLAYWPQWELSTGTTSAVCFSSGVLTGTTGPVADAGIADIAVVLTDDGGSPSLMLVDLTAPGVTRTRLDGFDQLRPHYEIDFSGVEAEHLPASSATILDLLFDRVAVLMAFEAIGGAEACLFMARDYAMQRQIFSRPLASYQAIKHRLADMYVAITLARSSANYAAEAVELGTDLAAAASSARLNALDAFELAARENLHVHGGLGYTIEADCHFFYRRERTLALSLGTRRRWAARLAAYLPGQEKSDAA